MTQMTQSVGNTKTTDSTKNVRARKYIFVLNNYSDTETQDIEQFLTQKATKWIFGFEICPSTGTPHLQGYMEFKSARSFDSLKRFCSRWHLQKARGSLEENYDYSSKDGNYRYGGFRPEKIAWTCCIEHLYPWQEKIIEIVKSEADDRTIHWFWEPNGCAGKTKLQKHIVCNFPNVLALGGKAADMKNGVVEYKKNTGELPDVILINIPRTNLEYLSYQGMEEVKDMLFYSGKYEGGMICGPCPHLICFANEPPFREKVSLDRWKIEKIE